MLQVAGSIPDEVIEFFPPKLILPPGIDFAPNRNEYRKSSAVKPFGA
jgi:hypothetical protein